MFFVFFFQGNGRRRKRRGKKSTRKHLAGDNGFTGVYTHINAFVSLQPPDVVEPMNLFRVFSGAQGRSRSGKGSLVWAIYNGCQLTDAAGQLVSQ